MGDGKQRSMYDMAKVLGRGYATVHKVVKRLQDEKVLKSSYPEEIIIPMRILYSLVK